MAGGEVWAISKEECEDTRTDGVELILSSGSVINVSFLTCPNFLL